MSADSNVDDYERFDTSALLDALEELKDNHVREQDLPLVLAVIHRLEVLEDIEERLGARSRRP